MKLAVQVTALGLALIGLSACHPGKTETRSQLHDESQGQGNPFPIKALSEDETKTVAARIGYIAGDGHPDNGKCIGCHSNFNNIDELDRLYNSTAWALSCFDKGVETAEQQLFLRAAGVHSMQGYRFGKPQPAGDISARLGQVHFAALQVAAS